MKSVAGHHAKYPPVLVENEALQLLLLVEELEVHHFLLRLDVEAKEAVGGQEIN